MKNKNDKDIIIIDGENGEIYWDGKEWDSFTDMTPEELRESLHTLVDELIATMEPLFDGKPLFNMEGGK